MTATELDARLDQYGVVSGPIYTIEDIANDPHYQARDMIQRYQDDELGDIAGRFQFAGGDTGTAAGNGDRAIAQRQLRGFRHHGAIDPAGECHGTALERAQRCKQLIALCVACRGRPVGSRWRRWRGNGPP